MRTSEERREGSEKRIESKKAEAGKQTQKMAENESQVMRLVLGITEHRYDLLVLIKLVRNDWSYECVNLALVVSSGRIFPSATPETKYERFSFV